MVQRCSLFYSDHGILSKNCVSSTPNDGTESSFSKSALHKAATTFVGQPFHSEFHSSSNWNPRRHHFLRIGQSNSFAPHSLNQQLSDTRYIPLFNPKQWLERCWKILMSSKNVIKAIPKNAPASSIITVDATSGSKRRSSPPTSHHVSRSTAPVTKPFAGPQNARLLPRVDWHFPSEHISPAGNVSPSRVSCGTSGAFSPTSARSSFVLVHYLNRHWLIWGSLQEWILFTTNCTSRIHQYCIASWGGSPLYQSPTSAHDNIREETWHDTIWSTLSDIVLCFSRYNHHLLGSTVVLICLVVNASLHIFKTSMPFTNIKAMPVLVTLPPSKADNAYSIDQRM